MKTNSNAATWLGICAHTAAHIILDTPQARRSRQAVENIERAANARLDAMEAKAKQRERQIAAAERILGEPAPVFQTGMNAYLHRQAVDRFLARADVC